MKKRKGVIRKREKLARAIDKQEMRYLKILQWHTVKSRITRRTLLPGEAHHEREFSRVLSASFNKFDIGRSLWHKHHYIHTG